MSNTKILIVEDEHIVALDIKTNLERYGYEVPGIYASGEKVLEELDSLSPDLVLMDIKLQGELDGIETSEKIKERLNIPVILLTAYADEDTLQRAKLTDPFAYIIKPFEERELRTSIVITLHRHEMEMKVAERERLFSTTFKSISDAVAVTDNKDRIEYINPVARRLCSIGDRPPEGLQYSEVFSITEPPQNDYFVSEINKDIKIIHAEGKEPIYVEQRSSDLLDENGKKSGMVRVIRNITERLKTEHALKASERQLRQAQKMEAIGRLSGGIAHDFNNLLTVIMGYSKLSLENESLNKEVRPDIEGIHSAAQKSASLTRQLLAFARHQVMEFRKLKLNTLISDLKKMLRRLIDMEVSMDFRLDADEDMVYVDQGQIEQVLINLVLNARDSMPEGGRISISTESRVIEKPLSSYNGEIPEGKYVTFSVEDTGIGIDENIQERIFEPFFTTKDSTSGTGLGLSTVYGIIQQSRGFIDVKSAPQQGSKFTIFLPYERGKEEERSTEKKILPDVRGSESILLVEDEDYLRSLLSKLLRNKGYRVEECRNAGEAILISENASNRFDLLVSDVVMPHLSGDRLAERLKKVYPNLKTLLISGYPERLNQKSFQEEAMHLLQKPFALDTFLIYVRDILDEKKPASD